MHEHARLGVTEEFSHLVMVRSTHWLASSMRLVMAVVLSLGASLPAHAAVRYKEGDAIEVFHLGEWRGGTVLKTNLRGDVLAEFEFAGEKQQLPFKAAGVRHAYESGALVRSRVWTDAEGVFREKAALIDVDEENLLLRKPDLGEVEIPIANLSEADQRFLDKLRKESLGVLAKPPKRPEVTEFGRATMESSITMSSGTARSALTADPLPVAMKFDHAGVGFPAADAFDRLGAVLPVGGDAMWVLAAVENTKPAQAMPTRLVWVSLARQKVESLQMLPAGERVLDYHALSGRLLTYSMEAGETKGAATMALWDVSAASVKPKPVLRWNVDSGEAGRLEPWGRIIGADVVVQRFGKHDYVGWDVTAKECRYRIVQQSFFAPSAALSPGRRYLLLPEDTGVRVFDAATGHQVSSLPVTGGVAGVAVSADGCRAAVLGATTLQVFDLIDPTASPRVIQAETIGTPFARQLSWVGDERLLVNTGQREEVLFGLSRQMSLWRYEFDPCTLPASPGTRACEVVDQHLVYGASLRDASSAGLAIGAVKMPGPRVDDAEAAVDPESLLIVKAGTPMRLEVRTGEYDVSVRTALEKKIQANGWALDPEADAVVVAEMWRGEQQTVTYRIVGTGRPESTQTANVKPYLATVKVLIRDQVAYSAVSSSGVPAHVLLEGGKSVQDEVDRCQRPNPGFFDTVTIPSRLIDPAKRAGLGTTKVTARGFVEP